MIVTDLHESGTDCLIDLIAILIHEANLPFVKGRNQWSMILQDGETSLRAWKLDAFHRLMEERALRTDDVKEYVARFSGHVRSVLFCLGKDCLTLFNSLFDCADIQEGLLRQVVDFSVKNATEALDCVLDVHHDTRHSSELLGDREWL